MKAISRKFNVTSCVLLITLVGMLLVSGCTRYARNADTLYEPTATVRGGAGDVYIVIPESQHTQSADIKWVLGKVMDDENNKIDELFSSQSPAEIVQTALGLEFKRAGYTVIPTTKRPAAEQRVLDLTKTEVELNQISSLVDIKATCRMLVGMDVFRNGQLIKRLQYESTSTKTDLRDRDMLARSVLQEALQSIMLRIVPESHNLLSH
jgi:hypothetical protein